MAHLEHTSTLRVILVGRTGLDAALRRDASIELIRARTALEGLGELSEPIDDESPGDSVMILGPDIESQNKPLEMAASVRIINPKCPLLLAIDGQPADVGFDGVIHPDADGAALRELLSRVTLRPVSTEPPARGFPFKKKGDKNGGGGFRGPTPQTAMSAGGIPTSRAGEDKPRRDYRHYVHEDPDPVPMAGASRDEAPVILPTPPRMPSVQVTRVVEEPIVPRPVAPMRREPVEHRPVIIPAGQSVMGDPFAGLSVSDCGSCDSSGSVRITSTNDDRDMVAAMLAGKSFMPVASELMRHRTGAGDVSFHCGESAPSNLTAARVSTGGKVVGHVCSAVAPKHALDDEAAWLSGWLALRDVHGSTRQSALADSLTGAYNRRFLDRFLPAAVEHARQHRHSLSVLMLDVDNFKSYNDAHGHGAGDEILSEITRLLKAVVREDDRVCRVGGDEFLVVLFEPKGPRGQGSRHPETALALAERFAKAIASHKFPKLGDQAVGHLTISGGLATFPWDGMSAAELIGRADAALMAAKRAGKNVIHVGR